MHTHKNKPEWQTEGLSQQRFKSLHVLFFIHALSLNLLSPQVSKWGIRAHQQRELMMVTAVQTAATLAATFNVRRLSNLKRAHWKHDGAICRGGIQALRCDAKGGSASRKEKWWLTKLPKIPLPPPYWFTGSGMLFFSPSSLRRSSSWQAAGSGPGLMFVCGIVSSLSVGANPANGFNYVRRTFESLLAVRGREWIDGALACETDKPLFCIITRHFIPVIYAGEGGIYQLPN